MDQEIIIDFSIRFGQNWPNETFSFDVDGKIQKGKEEQVERDLNGLFKNRPFN